VKLKICTLMIVALLLLVSADGILAQVDMYGVGSAGVLFNGDNTKFALAVGGNTKIKSDTGFVTYNQTIMKYSDGFKGSGEIQEVCTFIMSEKTLGIGKSYAAFGTGAIVGINDGSDDFNMAIKAELGYGIGWKCGLSIGIEYVPITDAPDRSFIYGSIDLFR